MCLCMYVYGRVSSDAMSWPDLQSDNRSLSSVNHHQEPHLGLQHTLPRHHGSSTAARLDHHHRASAGTRHEQLTIGRPNRLTIN